MASSVPVGRARAEGGGTKVEDHIVGGVAGTTGPICLPQGKMESGEFPPPLEGEEIPQRKKTTSFKITNVFLSRPPSNDGDESAEDPDDLDDSHTEELSDIADSLSSQLENVAAGNQAVNGLPQGKLKGDSSWKTSGPGEHRIPSDKNWDVEPYSHPGFGFVTYNQDAGYRVSYVDNTTGQLPIAGTMAVIVNNSSDKGAGVSEVPVSGQQDFKNRFKIVKVETTEPLKRGRWTCFDFVDKPAAKEKSSDCEKSVKSSATSTGRPTTSSRPASVAAKERPDPHSGGRTTTTAVEVQATTQTSAPVSMSVSEEREIEGSAAFQGHILRQSSSVPPDALRTGGYPANYPQPPHSLSTQPNLAPLAQQAQSPHGMTPQLLGQVIRLPDGQLAQVALAPYSVVPQQTSKSHQPSQQGSSGQGSGYPGQSLILQPLSTTSSVSNLPHQQVVINSAGQLLVSGPIVPGSMAPGSGSLPHQTGGIQTQRISQTQPPSQQLHSQSGGGQPNQSIPANQQNHQIIQNHHQQSQTSQNQGSAVKQASIPAQQTPSTSLQQNLQPSQQMQQTQSPQSLQQNQNQGQPHLQIQQTQPSQHINHPPGQPSGQPVHPTGQQPGNPTGQQSGHPAGQQPGHPTGQQQQTQTSNLPTPQQPGGHSVAQPAGQQVSVHGGNQPSHGQGPTGSSQPAVGQSGQPAGTQQQSISSNQAQNSVQFSQQVPVVVTLQHGQVRASQQPLHPSVPPPRAQYTSSQPTLSTVISAGGQTFGYPDTGVYSMDGEGLVERLEEISLLQGSDETKEGVQEQDADSASGAGQGTIDNRIEQAMDLVKSHLMSAVRSEVEELRDKITKLEESVTVLSRENEILRANVNPDILANLSNRGHSQIQQPPDANQH